MLKEEENLIGNMKNNVKCLSKEKTRIEKELDIEHSYIPILEKKQAQSKLRISQLQIEIKNLEDKFHIIEEMKKKNDSEAERLMNIEKERIEELLKLNSEQEETYRIKKEDLIKQYEDKELEFHGDYHIRLEKLEKEFKEKNKTLIDEQDKRNKTLDIRSNRYSQEYKEKKEKLEKGFVKN